MSASGRVFRFALLAESTARTATVLCDAAPTFATDSPRVAAFLRGFPQVTVRHLAARPEDAAVGQAVLQYVSRVVATRLSAELPTSSIRPPMLRATISELTINA